MENRDFFPISAEFPTVIRGPLEVRIYTEGSPRFIIIYYC